MTRTWTGLVAGGLLAGLLAGLLLPASADAAPASVPERASSACPAPTTQFAPTVISISGVLKGTKVLARGRDRYGVPLPPPLTSAGKWQFSWDKLSGIGADSYYGVMRLTAHTYPGGRDAALGNRLLAHLRVGATIRVQGSGGAAMCYRVDKRVSVRSTQPLLAYYDDVGPHRLGIVVCSGVRRGPGDWSRRTVWFAAPVT